MQTEALEFDAGGLKLRGRLYRPAGTAKDVAALFLHGWTGLPNEPAAELLAGNGYTALTFSLSGHNDSDGRLEDQTVKKSLDEAFAAYDLLVSKVPTGTRIVLVGNSYGGYLALLMSTQRPVVALSLRVPANYLDEGFELPRQNQGHENQKVMEWRRQRLEPDATESLRAIHQFQGPIQIIEAEQDDIVPHQTVQNYIDAMPDQTYLDYHLMRDWPHSLGTDRIRNENFRRILLNWLEQKV